jgi:hypothetical protein
MLGVRLDCKAVLIDCVAAAVTELLDAESPIRSIEDDPPPLPSIGLSVELAGLLECGKPRK